MNQVAVVIRSYNNPKIVECVERFLAMGVGKILVVVHATADKGATRMFLDEIGAARLEIIEIHTGYTWANALNRAIIAIQIANVTHANAYRFIFPVSVEAIFTADDLVAMMRAITLSTGVGVVGTSFVGILDDKVIGLGRSYQHPRNTGMLISLEAIGSLWGGFDARCDDMGGMEDIDFVLRMRALSNCGVVMLDRKVKLLLGKHYDQAQKEAREQGAMDKIIALWRSLFAPDSFERRSIDKVVAEMKLEVTS